MVFLYHCTIYSQKEKGPQFTRPDGLIGKNPCRNGTQLLISPLIYVLWGEEELWTLRETQIEYLWCFSSASKCERTGDWGSMPRWQSQWTTGHDLAQAMNCLPDCTHHRYTALQEQKVLSNNQEIIFWTTSCFSRCGGLRSWFAAHAESIKVVQP